MSKIKGIGGHQSANMRTNEWITPPEIIKCLGEFDLDPCSPVNRPWPTAKKHFTIEDNGLLLPWEGRVWLNPPYGKEMELWLQKMSKHLYGIALIFARTDTNAFHKYVFPFADSLFFLQQRLTFYNTAGMKATANGGAPSVLIGYGEQNVDAIADSGMKGKHVLINNIPVVVIGVSPSWKNVVSIVLTRLGGEAPLQKIYDMVEVLAPDKIEKNKFFKEKVRQKLQDHFVRIRKGYYSSKCLIEEVA